MSLSGLKKVLFSTKKTITSQPLTVCANNENYVRSRTVHPPDEKCVPKSSHFPSKKLMSQLMKDRKIRKKNLFCLPQLVFFRDGPPHDKWNIVVILGKILGNFWKLGNFFFCNKSWVIDVAGSQPKPRSIFTCLFCANLSVAVPSSSSLFLK